MKSIISFFKQLFIIFFITLLLIEIISFFFIKLNLIGAGLPSWLTQYAHKDYTVWHPKNVTFKKIESKGCWVSNITYNNFGMRGIDDVSLLKTKKRIALLGDSMIENIELSDGKDVGSLIAKKLKDYEILNFSARSTGLADQKNIYEKLIKKFDVDYLFLFIHPNDFINNSINGNGTSYHRRFDVINNSVVEIPKDLIWMENYNSKFKKLKREYSIYFKNYNSYKIYLFLRDFLKKKEVVKKKTNFEKKNFYIDYFEKNKIIYKHLKKEFSNTIDPKVKFYVILNLQPYFFLENEKLNEEEFFIKYNVIPFFEEIWSDYSFVNPIYDAKKIIDKNNYKIPYFSWTCGDKHYNEKGSDFISDLVVKTIIKK